MIKRAISLALTVCAVFVLSRGLIRSLPGDPLETLLAESGVNVPRELLKEELKLDRSFVSAVAQDAGAALRGDFGVSLFSRQPIGPVLSKRFTHTLALTLVTLFLGLSVSLALGLSACANPRLNRLCSLHGAWAAALPTPWIGPILAYLFSVCLPIFPIGGHIALPALTLAIGFSGLWARLIRDRVQETLLLGAAPGARARGVSEFTVLWKYGLAPASGPLLAYLGTQFGHLLAGTVVVEVLFDWPGLGSYFVESVLRRDYPAVEAVAFVTASCALLGNALGDWMQNRVDPRRSHA